MSVALVVPGLALAAAGATAQEATASLRAVITAAETGEPIAGATVRIGGENGKVGRSDADGAVLIGGIEPGSHIVVVEAPGYAHAEARIDFEASGVVKADVTLESALDAAGPIPLDTVDVTVEGRSAKLATVGFYTRLEDGRGTFLTPEAVAERVARASRLSGVFRGIPGLRVSLNPTARQSSVFMLEIPRGRNQLALGGRSDESSMRCHPRVWLDGVRLPRDAAEDINRVTGPRQVAAIEIYSGPAEIPTQFNVTGSQCGAVVIWTGPRPEGGS